jgi:outer membrane protein OmpA-like peptidoglycan-associated protein/regulator of replication initiation timing
MRPILIAGVLIFTLLTFYSALWYKSEEIEIDITNRVTEDLTAANADGVGIDVDGRHVTLSGVVYDEAAEQSYLDVANDTYGALGPIDGLTYLADDGFIKAVKTDAGITLSGTVPSEEVRESLLAQAGAATAGTVEDKLTVSGRAADWQNEAGFGVAQLAGLTAGALTATAGSYTLSGTAQDDAGTVTQAVSEREGWSAFVSAPDVSADLSQQIDDLSATVAQRDGQISNLSGELAAANGQLSEVNSENDGLKLQRSTLSATVAGLVAERNTVTGERDAVTNELEALRASLTDTQTDSATLAAQLAAARADRDTAVDAVKGRDVTIEGLNGEISGLTGQVDALVADNTRLEDELAKRQAALGSTDDQVVDLRAQLAERVVALNDANAENGTLRAQIATRDRTIKTLEGDLEDSAEALSASNARVTALAATVVEREGTITVLRGRATSAEAKASSAEAQVTDLTSTVKTSDAKITDLEAQLAAMRADQGDSAARIPPLEARIETLEGQVEGYEGLVSSLRDQNGTLQGRVDGYEGLVETLEGQITDLNGTVEDRDVTIAALRARPDPEPVVVTQTAPAADLAGECSARAEAVMEGTNINFRSGTARLDNASTALLERLTGIALACVSDDLTVEVGGHTDNQGSDASNQRLSERRAQAVVDFMTERGVAASGLTAVGFGEANPIASNGTATGRRANRRITFDWQAR